MGEYKEATSGEVVKFENEGDSLEGEFVGYEESTQYEGSYAIKVKEKNGSIKVVFTSKIAVDLIESNSIKSGQQIKLEFCGKVEAQDGKFEYNTYKLLYK